MRTILISLLLAGVASPALAVGPARDEARDRSERAERKAEREAKRPERNAEPRNVERAAPQRSFEPRNIETVSKPIVEPRSFEPRSIEIGHDRPRRSGEGAVRQMRGRSIDVSGGPDVRLETPQATPADHRVRERRMRDRTSAEVPTTIETRNLRRAPPLGESGGLVQQKRSMPRVFERAERRISTKPILGTEPPPPRTATAIAARPERHWRSDWRNDRRYDWRDWRRRHRSRFHFGFYSDPFGWDYFRYGIGWRLWPSYYRSSYWLRDPWEYRLPPAYGPYRWVRYYNDALLVNIYTGQVVDVEYNFFW